MARSRARARARSKRRMANASTITNRQGGGGGPNASLLPRVLLGAVDGVGAVAVGTLQLARDVLIKAVSGAANIGAEAVTATVAGTRGVVSATSHTVADIATTAQNTFLTTIDTVRHSRRGAARAASRHRLVLPLTGEPDEKLTSAPSTARSRGRRRGRRPRLVKQPARLRVAA